MENDIEKRLEEIADANAGHPYVSRKNKEGKVFDVRGDIAWLIQTVRELRIENAALKEQVETAKEVNQERVAQLIAHRVCIGLEHDPQNGKLHGYCVVCGVPWPCEYAGHALSAPAKEKNDQP